MWTNIEEQDRPPTIWRMRIACWIPKGIKYILSGCVTLIALPLQQWLHERASVLGYKYTVCRVILWNVSQLRDVFYEELAV
jgi:hypothetical protein